MPISELLFDPVDLPPAVRYDMLFQSLPELPERRAATGRPPISRNSVMKALIYKALRRIPTLRDLQDELNNNPCVAQVLALNPLKSAPSVERFSSFLHDTDNQELKTIHRQLVQSLLADGALTGTSLAIDSCPIVVPLRENNLKTSMANRFDKTRHPSGDADATLGVMIHYPNPFQKKVHYFWGYRNHIINDTATELPLGETTAPAHIHERHIAKPLILETQKMLHLNIQVVVADANFDAESFLQFVIRDLHALAIVPHNPRNTQSQGYRIDGDQVLCAASLPMYRKGKMRHTRTGILYCQWACPLVYDRKVRPQYLLCPASHPKFFKGKGCNVLIRLQPSIREHIDYGTAKFKELYDTRTSVERIFSRLLSLAMQHPTVRGLQAIRNHVTLAHIAVLLVALTAHRTKQTDKMRFVRSFVANFINVNIKN